ncbi:MAG: histidine kinase [Hyphomicrobiaceae bacterium]|nr:histidine kinase [Hyphomicrobiaceae bacterium]
MQLNSLAFRLFATTVAWTFIVLPLAGVLIYALYRNDTVASHDRRLGLLLTVLQSDSIDNGGDVPGTSNDVGEPLFSVSQSGWYWQIKPLENKPGRRLISESLADDIYPLPSELNVDPGDDEKRWATVIGPASQTLRVVEVMHVFGQGAEAQRYSISVAGTLAEVERSLGSFRARLLQALTLAGFGLIAVTLFQVRFGLQPLRAIEKNLSAIRTGDAQRLDGKVPAEIAPLQAELNALLKSNQEIVERARTQVGNLAHALKTPIAVLVNEARDDKSAFGGKVIEQTELMRDQVTHYLNRARMAANVGVIGRATDVKVVGEALARTLQRIYKEKRLDISVDCPDGLRFKGERQDLEEMLGNLMDNACKWSIATVRLTARPLADTTPARLELLVEDDGPGLTDEQLAAPVQRGRRLDETQPGSGLGHSIVADLTSANAGTFERGKSDLGGLKVRLILPLAAA